MSNADGMYRMTEAQRQKYLLLLFSNREQEALALRDRCDDYWRNHTDEWEKVRVPDNQPVKF